MLIVLFIYIVRRNNLASQEVRRLRPARQPWITCWLFGDVVCGIEAFDS